VSCRHPKYPNHVVTVFFGQTPATATKIARLLFFYGWQSYVVFREGAVVERGDFPPEANELEVRFHAS
jgi:aminopeptidase N